MVAKGRTVLHGLCGIGVGLVLTGLGDAQVARAQEPSETHLEDYTEHIEAHLEGFEMIAIPAGTVEVPNPENPSQTHEVEVGPFWISRTPVIWDEYNIWAQGMDADYDPSVDALSRPTVATEDFDMDRGWGWGDRPAIGVTHRAAETYAEWLSEQSGAQYRVPTEAEWIYACRAEAEATNLDADELANHAWFADNADGKTHPVGQLEPNAFGLHDMLGNVAEWVDGIDGDPAVLGGSFRTEAEEVSCTYRQTEDGTWQGMVIPVSDWWFAEADFTGIRLVREPADEESE